jgi:hypothetical protein
MQEVRRKMNTLNHLAISMAIGWALRKKLGIRLDMKGFMYGNVKPDISSYLISIPHFKKHAFGFIASEIKKLMATEIKKNSVCTKQFSERLGIVTHYLSDFFCHAHTDTFKGSLLKHYLYEARLYRYYLKKPVLRMVSGYLDNFIPEEDYSSVCRLINQLHSRYLSKRSSYACDIVFTLRICTLAAASIVTACTCNSLEIAA